MKRILILLTLMAGLAAVNAAASILPAVEASRSRSLGLAKHYVEVAPGVRMAVKGERERRQVRYARLVNSWSADQQSVAATAGFPYHRFRELAGSRLTETWFYPDQNLQYVFDRRGRLIGQSLR